MSGFTPLFLPFVIGWVIWKIFRRYFVRSPLDNIPGLAPKSFSRGAFNQCGWDRLHFGWMSLPLILGNLSDLFSRHGFSTHDYIAKNYGQVVRYHGAFGVSYNLCTRDANGLICTQARCLYVFDPKALSSIVMKDQMLYEEPTWFSR
jgi:hypothetical protein